MIRIHIDVKPGSFKNELTVIEPHHWRVKIRAKPVDGEANEALLFFLSERFHISKSKISIEKGVTSRHKVIMIDTEEIII